MPNQNYDTQSIQNKQPMRNDIVTPLSTVTGDLIHDTTKTGYSFSNVVSTEAQQQGSYKTPEITLKTTKNPTLTKSPSRQFESDAERLIRLKQELERGDIDPKTFLDLILYKRPMTKRPNVDTTSSPELKVSIMSETPMEQTWVTSNAIMDKVPSSKDPVTAKPIPQVFQTTKMTSSPVVFSARTTPMKQGAQQYTEVPKSNRDSHQNSVVSNAREPQSDSNRNQPQAQMNDIPNGQFAKDTTPSQEMTRDIVGLQVDAAPLITKKAFNLLSSGGASLDVLQYHERQASQAGVPSGLGQPADRDMFRQEVTGVPVQQRAAYSGLSFSGLSAQMAPVFADSSGHQSQTMSPDRFDNYDFVNGISVRRGHPLEIRTTTESWMPRTQVQGSLSQMSRMNNNYIDQNNMNNLNNAALGLTAHESFEQKFGLSNSVGKPSIDFTGGSSSLGNLGNVVSSGSISSFENRRRNSLQNNRFANGQIVWDSHAGQGSHQMPDGQIFTQGQMSNMNRFSSGQLSNGNNFNSRASPQRRANRVVNQQFSNPAPTENVQINLYEFGSENQGQGSGRLSNGFGGAANVPSSFQPQTRESIQSPSQASRPQPLGSLSNPNSGLESGVLVSASGQNMEIHVARGIKQKTGADKNVISHSLGSHFAFVPESQGPSDILMPNSQMLSSQKLGGGNFRTFGQKPRQQQANPRYNPKQSNGVLVSSRSGNSFGRFDNSGFTRPPVTPSTPQPELPRDIPFRSGGSLSNVPNPPPPPPLPSRFMPQVKPRPPAPSRNTMVRPSAPSIPSQNVAPQPSNNVCGYREVLHCEGRGFHRRFPGIGEQCVRTCTSGHCPAKRCQCECRNTMTGSRRPFRSSNPLHSNMFQGSNV